MPFEKIAIIFRQYISTQKHLQFSYQHQYRNYVQIVHTIHIMYINGLPINYLKKLKQIIICWQTNRKLVKVRMIRWSMLYPEYKTKHWIVQWTDQLNRSIKMPKWIPSMIADNLANIFSLYLRFVIQPVYLWQIYLIVLVLFLTHITPHNWCWLTQTKKALIPTRSIA